MSVRPSSSVSFYFPIFQFFSQRSDHEVLCWSVVPSICVIRLIFWIGVLSRLVLFPVRRQWNCRYFLRISVGSKDWPIRDLFSYSDILGSPTSSQLCAIVTPVSDRQGTIPLLSYIRRDFWFSSTTSFEWDTLVDHFVPSRKEFQYRSTLKVKLVPRLSVIAWTIFQ